MADNAITRGSLADMAQRSGAGLAQTFLNVDMVVLLDVSGSMSARDARGGLSRHDAAQRELVNLQEAMPGRVALVVFSNYPLFCPGGIPERLNGGTNLSGALEFIRVADRCGVGITVISDGLPDDPGRALSIAGGFGSPINVIYIGPEIGEGARFMQDLASACRGIGQVKSVDEIEVTVTHLLTAG